MLMLPQRFTTGDAQRFTVALVAPCGRIGAARLRDRAGHQIVRQANSGTLQKVPSSKSTRADRGPKPGFVTDRTVPNSTLPSGDVNLMRVFVVISVMSLLDHKP